MIVLTWDKFLDGVDVEPKENNIFDITQATQIIAQLDLTHADQTAENCYFYFYLSLDGVNWDTAAYWDTATDKDSISTEQRATYGTKVKVKARHEDSGKYACPVLRLYVR